MCIRGDITTRHIERVGERLKRYGYILLIYPIFNRLGTGMHQLGDIMCEDLVPTSENAVLALSCLESLVFTLHRWRAEIFSGVCAEPNMYDNSMLSDIEMIGMALQNLFEEEDDEIEFF